MVYHCLEQSNFGKQLSATSIQQSFFPFNINEAKHFLFKWTPRAMIAGIGAYYGLGVAYEIGGMAALDKLAIHHLLIPLVGRVGLGLWMPTFQWYSSIGVRIVMAATAGLVYDLSLRIACYIKKKILC